METRFHIVALLIFILSPVLANSGAKDIAREQEIAKQLEATANETEVIWLEADQQQFIGLFRAQTQQKAAGAIILLHGMGGHADWPYIISPLREALPEQGWSTLSIQLPVLAMDNPIENYGVTLDAAANRLEAAIRYLRARKFLNIFVVGHSFGAATALYYLSNGQRPKILALISIGLQEYVFLKPAINTFNLLEKARLPILDIFGELDYREVIDNARIRRLAANKGNNDKYKQIEIVGAGHNFLKMEEMLAKHIHGWLDKAFPVVSIMVNENFDGNQSEKEADKAE